MPDRLGDFLANSEQPRHRLVCPACGTVIRAITPLGARLGMRTHRAKFCPGKQESRDEVTEPPDPRDPENVGDPEEFDPELARELAEMLESEQIDELADDMLLDEVGRGEDHRTILDFGIPDEEWELQDHLHDIREQTEDEPVPELVSTEEALKIIAEAKKKREEEQAAAQRRAQSQGDDKVAISDDAQRVAQIANDASAIQAMEQAIGALDDALGKLRSAEEDLSKFGQALQVAGEAASSQATEAGNLLGGEDGQSVLQQGQGLAQSISDALSKVANIDIGGVLQHAQGVDLTTLAGRIHELRETIKNMALKHQ